MPNYARIIAEMKDRYELRVHRWRKRMSGCAWRVYYADGRTINWIESPWPRSTVSLAVFLHEVGHHVIGFDRYRVRCEEEFHAWKWAIDQMCRLGVEPDKRVHERFERSMQYAVGKALRRGLKRLPNLLVPFLPKAA